MSVLLSSACCMTFKAWRSSRMKEEDNNEDVQSVKESVKDNEEEKKICSSPSLSDIDREADNSTSSAYLDLLGVSVDWLATGFMDEIINAGKDGNCKIYEIEDLYADECGVIRQKGENVISPVDNELGAAYVHCLNGIDQVGPAQYMLSYSWGYTVNDIVSTLTTFCDEYDLDRKETKIWICCLCVNQHRVVENNKKGVDVPTEIFNAVFCGRVKGIGHILAMFLPWYDPEYLKRCWCLFELFTADVNKCKVSIVMPLQERMNLMNNLLGSGDESASNIHAKQVGLDSLYNALSNTRVQDAKASVEKDKTYILQLIQDGHGFSGLNKHVNTLLRDWVRTVIESLIKSRANDLTDEEEEKLSYATFCEKVGSILLDNEEKRLALNMWTSALKIRKEILGEDHIETVRIETEIVLLNATWKGARKYALIQHQKALQMYLNAYGENHVQVAKIYHCLGIIYHLNNNYNGALVSLRKALEVKKTLCQSEEDGNFADIYAAIGNSLVCKGDGRAALGEYEKARAIRKKVLGEYHPKTLGSMVLIGDAYQKQNNYQAALKVYKDVCASQELVLGYDHSDTKDIYDKIGDCLRLEGCQDEARVYYRKMKIEAEYTDQRGEEWNFKDAFCDIVDNDEDIEESTVILRAHSDSLYSNWLKIMKYDNEAAIFFKRKAISTIESSAIGKKCKDLVRYYEELSEWLDYEESLSALEKAKTIAMNTIIYGENHFETLRLRRIIAKKMLKNEHYNDALAEYLSILEIQRLMFEPMDNRIALSLHTIGTIYMEKAQHEKAIMYYRQAFAIKESNIPKSSLLMGNLVEKAAIYNDLGDALRENSQMDDAFVQYSKCSAMFKSSLAVSETLRKNKRGRILSAICGLEVKMHMVQSYGRDDVADKLVKKGQYTNAIDELCKAIQIQQSTFGQKSVIAAKTMYKLAKILLSKNDNESALHELRNAIDIFQLTKEYRWLAKCHKSMSDTMENMKMFRESVVHLDSAIVAFESIPLKLVPAPKVVKTPSFIRLGAVEADHIPGLKGDFDSYYQLFYRKAVILHKHLDQDSIALKTLQKATTVLETVLGEHRDTAESYKGRGHLSTNIKQYDEAEDQYRNALRIFSSLYGSNHPKTASCADEIANLLFLKGNYDDALQQYESVLESRLSIFNENNIKSSSIKQNFDSSDVICMNYNKIGDCYRAKGLLENALNLYRKAYPNDKRLSSQQDDGNDADVYDQFGDFLFWKKNDTDNAVKVRLKAIEILESNIEADKETQLLPFYSKILKFLKICNHYDDAIDISKKIIQTKVDLLGSTIHPDLISCHINLSMLLHKSGKFEGALKELEKAKSIQRKSFNDSPTAELARVHHVTGEMYNEKAEYETAMKNYDQAVTILEMCEPKSEHGHRHPAMSAYQNSITKLLLKLNRYDEALISYRKEQGQYDALSNDSMEKADSYDKFAQHLTSFFYNDIDGSILMKKKAIQIRKNVGSGDDPYLVPHLEKV